MKIQYYAEIQYTMDSSHPDIKCVEGWTEDKVFTFSDTYTFDYPYEKEDVVGYIFNDLKLVAGGGYNSDHIQTVSFTVNRI